jgi:hypothetical protein
LGSFLLVKTPWRKDFRVDCPVRKDESCFVNGVTFDHVLNLATNLPEEEQELLSELLRKRRIESWREETAAEAKRIRKAFRAGKLKARAVDAVINDLRAAVKKDQ